MQVQSPDQEDPLEKGNGNPFQYSCLKNSMDRGAWQTAGYDVKKSRTRLKQLSVHMHMRKVETTQMTLLENSEMLNKTE